MESRIHRLFLTAACMVVISAFMAVPAPVTAAAKTDFDSEPVIDPDLDRREIKEADIDTEDFVVGGFAGVMAVEDFGSNFVYGVRGAYNVTEDIFVEAAWGRTDTEETSFERLSGGAQILSDDDRQLTYYNLSFGWNIFPGEVFVTSRWAFNSAFYLIGGVGSTNFAGEDEFTWNAGAGFRLLASDWLAFRVDGRDHVFKSDILGEENTMHNLEFTAGLSVFF